MKPSRAASWIRCSMRPTALISPDRPNPPQKQMFSATGMSSRELSRAAATEEVHSRVHDFYAAGQIQENVFGANNPEDMKINKLGEFP